jgi:hypothetical protein
MVHARPGLGYRYREGEVSKIEQDKGVEAETSSTRLPPLALPVAYRNQAFGTIVAHKPVGAGAWTEEEVTLLRTLVDQLGVTLESARLFQDTQRRAAHDRILGEVATHMRETLDMDVVLQTAVREIGEALGITEVQIRMGGSRLREPGPLDRAGGDGDGENEGKGVFS